MFQCKLIAGDAAPEALADRIAGELDALSHRHLALARRLYRERRVRVRHFAHGLFAEPVWDILLDLFIAECEGKTITISSACIAADVPATTALRHLGWLIAEGLLTRAPHPVDARSSVVRLTGKGDRAMRAYLDEVDR